MGCALVESLGRKKESKDSVPFPLLRTRGRSPISTGYQTRDWVLGFGSSTFGHWFTTALSKVVLKGTCSSWSYSTFYVGSDFWPALDRGNFRSALLVLGGRSNLMVKLGRMSSSFSHFIIDLSTVVWIYLCKEGFSDKCLGWLSKQSLCPYYRGGVLLSIKADWIDPFSSM